MFSTLFILAVLFAVSTAFSPARFAVRGRSMQMADGWKPLDDPKERSADGRCLKKDVDIRGKCPGDSGYKPPVGNGKIR